MKDHNNARSRCVFPEKLAKDYIIASLRERFVVADSHIDELPVSIVDSFEWALYQNNMIAFRDLDYKLHVWNSDNLYADESVGLIESNTPEARFWWDFKESAPRDILQKLLKLRALMPMAEGTLTIENHSLQDNNGKTQVFLQIASFYRTEEPDAAALTEAELIPVTGYDSEYREASKIMFGLGGFEPSLNPIDSLLSAIGVTPKPYNVKPDLQFEAGLPARSAANYIISQMIEKQRLTEQGVIDDIDTEFLHHFRVALRMSRAAIAQLKEVYPEKDVVMLKERFGKLGRTTNHLRDLDVFILDKSRYLQLLPDSLSAGLLPMFDDFEREREEEVKRIADWLCSDEYKQEIAELQALFDNGYAACETQWSQKPAIELATSKIMKRYKKIQKLALKITDHTPDDDIHSIRIDCKKLRYLLYFFGSLFDKKALNKAVKQLKRLQDRLGIFNDLTVQGTYLETYLDKIEHRENKDIYLIAALGGLIATLHRMQKMERDNCIEELHVFSSDDNTKTFTNAFSGKRFI